MTPWRPRLLLVGLLAVLLLSGHSAAPAAGADVQVDLEACRADARYRGGAAKQATCLDARRASIEQEIERIVETEVERFCVGADSEAVRAAQQDWLAYRTMQCNLVERSPGDGASALDAGACRLLLTRQRLEALSLSASSARPVCPDLRLSAAASKPGRQDGAVRRIPGSEFAWRVSGERAAANLTVHRYAKSGRPKAVAELDLSSCRFCAGPPETCDKSGIFVLQQSDLPSRPFLLAVCREGGRTQRLRLLDPEAFGSAVQLQVTGDDRLEWALEDGRLRVLADRGRPIVWPPDRRTR